MSMSNLVSSQGIHWIARARKRLSLFQFRLGETDSLDDQPLETTEKRQILDFAQEAITSFDEAIELFILAAIRSNLAKLSEEETLRIALDLYTEYAHAKLDDELAQDIATISDTIMSMDDSMDAVSQLGIWAKYIAIYKVQQERE
jgi:hypothetical protein